MKNIVVISNLLQCTATLECTFILITIVRENIQKIRVGKVNEFIQAETKK